MFFAGTANMFVPDDSVFMLLKCMCNISMEKKSIVCNVVCKYLGQFLGSIFGVAALPIYCNIVCKHCLQVLLATLFACIWDRFLTQASCCHSANILQHCLQVLFALLFANIWDSFLAQASVLLLCQYTATLFASIICNAVCKCLRQFLGSSFSVATLPIYCNIVFKYCSQCCLRVSETVSWHKLWCCYSANILQHCLQVLLAMLFTSIWGSFLAQASVLLLCRYIAALRRGEGLDLFLQSEPFQNFQKFFQEWTWS